MQTSNGMNDWSSGKGGNPNLSTRVSDQPVPDDADRGTSNQRHALAPDFAESRQDSIALVGATDKGEDPARRTRIRSRRRSSASRTAVKGRAEPGAHHDGDSRRLFTPLEQRGTGRPCSSSSKTRLRRPDPMPRSPSGGWANPT